MENKGTSAINTLPTEGQNLDSGLKVTREDVGDFDQLITDYYKTQIRNIKIGQRRQAKELLEEHLILPHSRKRSAKDIGYIEEKLAIGKKLLDKLENARLIRSIRHNQNNLIYEISHDTLVEPILNERRIRIGVIDFFRKNWIYIALILLLLLLLSFCLGMKFGGSPPPPPPGSPRFIATPSMIATYSIKIDDAIIINNPCRQNDTIPIKGTIFINDTITANETIEIDYAQIKNDTIFIKDPVLVKDTITLHTDSIPGMGRIIEELNICPDDSDGSDGSGASGASDGSEYPFIKINPIAEGLGFSGEIKIKLDSSCLMPGQIPNRDTAFNIDRIAQIYLSSNPKEARVHGRLWIDFLPYNSIVDPPPGESPIIMINSKTAKMQVPKIDLDRNKITQNNKLYSENREFKQEWRLIDLLENNPSHIKISNFLKMESLSEQRIGISTQFTAVVQGEREIPKTQEEKIVREITLAHKDGSKKTMRVIENQKRSGSSGGDNNVGNLLNLRIASREIEYTVKQGETLYSIAKKYNISWKTLRDYNNLPDSTVKLNKILYIPPK